MTYEKITVDNLELFTYTNYDLCKEIKGIVLFFHGLGETGLIREPNDDARWFAEHGLLFAIPFYGPWAWMNKYAVKMIDRVVDVIIEKYGLPKDIPLISSGLSMGGLGSMTYPRFSAHKDQIRAVAANCPVCDLIHLRDNRRDIPKSTYYAFLNYDMDMDEAVKTVSPIEHVEEEPYIPYFIAHCTADTDVPKAFHSDRFVPKMIETGHDVTYVVVHDRTHCALDEMTFEGFRLFCLKHATK